MMFRFQRQKADLHQIFFILFFNSAGRDNAVYPTDVFKKFQNLSQNFILYMDVFKPEQIVCLQLKNNIMILSNVV